MLAFGFSFFNDPATTELYTLPLHDDLPISDGVACRLVLVTVAVTLFLVDRKSTR